MRCILALTFLAAAVAAQDPFQERYAKKLAQPFVKNAEWARTLAAAKERAQTTGKPVFAYFTRSYAP